MSDSLPTETAETAASADRAIDTAIFDLGGVLMHNGRPKDVGSRFGDRYLDVIELIMGPHGEDTDHGWHRLERGEITLEQARTEQRDALELAGIEIPPRPPRAEADFAFQPNEAMLATVRDLRAAGIRTGMLTNNVREFRELWWPLMPWHELFDDIVDSHEVGIRKPNPAIYQLSLKRLGAVAERSVFVDDLKPNVEGARALGMHGVWVDDDSSSAIAEVRRLAALAALPG